MACPFFEPTEAVETGPWLHRPRLPLGETYAGLCHAADSIRIEGAGRDLCNPARDLCNHGYARGRCEHFPSACQADAVRFSVIQESPLRLVYILEKDYAPLEHGVIEAAEQAPNSILSAQARAFLSSHARLSPKARKGRAGT